MTREFAQCLIPIYLKNDYPKSLQLIQDYGYSTFEPSVLFSNLKPSTYFENYKQDVENKEVQLFYSGFRKYIIENKLLKTQEEHETIFSNLFDTKEYESISKLIEVWELMMDKDEVIFTIVKILDTYFVRNNFQSLCTNGALQNWVRLMKTSIEYLEKCINDRKALTICFSQPSEFDCDCDLCSSVNSFIKDFYQKKFEFSFTLSNTQVSHIRSKLKKFSNTLDSCITISTSYKSSIQKKFTTQEIQTYQLKLMKNAKENLRDLQKFLLDYQLNPNLTPQFVFSRLLDKSRIEKERIAQKKQRKEQEILEKERKKNEKKRKEHELIIVWENDQKKKKGNESANPPNTSSSISSSQTIPTTVMFNFQFGSSNYSMIGMPITPMNGSINSLFPQNINFNNNIRQLNRDTATHQALSRYTSTAITWTPNPTDIGIGNLTLQCNAKHYCIAVQLSAMTFFILLPIQLFFPNTNPLDCRFVSIVTDGTGMSNLLLNSEIKY